MKARVKATGEIVDVDFDKDALANDYPPYRTNEIPSRFFLAEQLEWIDIKEKAEPNYWEKLKHQYAGMAMQAILSSNVMMEILSRRDNGTMEDEVAMEANDYATALVEKLKSESNDKERT